ncbi:hypothetical protein Cgig2_019171 [Carnegiea gigantea]|uniref:Uncharacterized protein n=1 Tax=Carnegiea gigantea TaxID=171969 RepID=A0A9Q1Q9N2_9CARY|nr:hypothetical protein Cgig2_019171 [Carnegiea gigantea]
MLLQKVVLFLPGSQAKSFVLEQELSAAPFLEVFEEERLSGLARASLLGPKPTYCCTTRTETVAAKSDDANRSPIAPSSGHSLQSVRPAVSGDITPCPRPTIPLIAKNRGRRSPETKSSSFSMRVTPKGPLGMMRPNTKAPNTECVPIASVTNPAIITPKSLKGSPSGVRLIIHMIMGRTTKMHIITNAVLERMTYRDVMEFAFVSARAMARAKRIHAHMSLTRADDIAMRPISVLISLSSAKILASTGKAVTARATPMNRMKVASCLNLCSLSMMRLKVQPIAKGRIMPPIAKLIAFLPVRLITARSISTPMRKRKYRRPMLAIVSSTMTLLKGKIVLAKLLNLPNTDGPSITPPCSA